MKFLATALFALSAGATLVTAANTGRATYFQGDGLTGPCGFSVLNNAPIVALSPYDYASGAHCGKTIEVTYGSNTLLALVGSICPSCAAGEIDLTVDAYEVLGPLSTGYLIVDWSIL